MSAGGRIPQTGRAAFSGRVAAAGGDSRAGVQRRRISQEAARLMLEGGLKDYALAKRKAAERLGVAKGGVLPGNDEVEDALKTYQRLFRSHLQPRRLRELRRLARDLMIELDAYRPRLVGPVLAGSADEHSDLTLHLFADSAEEVGMFLLDRGVAFRPSERRLRFSPGEVVRVAAYELDAEDVRVELVVFSGRLRRRAPLCPIDGRRPMARAGLAEVERLSRGDAEADQSGT